MPDTATPSHSQAQVRDEAFREFAFRFSSMTGALPILILLRDIVFNPEMVSGTLPMRCVVTLLMLAYPWALRMQAPRPTLPWILYGCAAAVEVLVIHGLASRPQGAQLYQWALIYFFILTPLLGLPLTLKANLLGMGGLLLAPTLMTWTQAGATVPLGTFYMMVSPACLVMTYLHVLAGQLSDANYRYRIQIEQLAMRDALTGLYNRRHFMQTAETALKLAHRGTHPACVLILDIDHFKSVNDRFGHGAGDEVIRAAGRGILDSLRETDLCARIGGEEFAAFLPHTDAEAGHQAAERIRVHLEAMTVPLHNLAEPLRFTVSLGLAARGSEDSLETLLERADHGLYAAKRGGRNRVELGS